MVLRGALATLKTMGLPWLVREAARRLLGLGYEFNGVPVSSSTLFRALRALLPGGTASTGIMATWSWILAGLG